MKNITKTIIVLRNQDTLQPNILIQHWICLLILGEEIGYTTDKLINCYDCKMIKKCQKLNIEAGNCGATE